MQLTNPTLAIVGAATGDSLLDFFTDATAFNTQHCVLLVASEECGGHQKGQGVADLRRITTGGNTLLPCSPPYYMSIFTTHHYAHSQAHDVGNASSLNKHRHAQILHGMQFNLDVTATSDF
jgi:hypothetical protein